MRTARYVVTFLLAVGCGDAIAPSPTTEAMPPGYVALQPTPSEYPGYWAAVEKCAGVKAPLSRVSFFIYPDSAFIPGGKFWMGATRPPEHEIYFGSIFWNDPPNVRHEMLHDLLQMQGHPAEYFGIDINGKRAGAGRCYDQVWHVPQP